MMRKTTVYLTLAALVCAGASNLLSQSNPKPKEKDEKPSGEVTIRVEVTGGENNQPVENASVYVRYVEPRALKKDRKVELNVKTNREGIARVPQVPRGKVQIQVVAEGWKPFGRWCEIEEEGQIIKVHLEKPPKWY